MDLERDDFFGPFGITGTFGAFLLLGGFILAVYALLGIQEYSTFLGWVTRLVNPDAQADFMNLFALLLMALGAFVFGGLLVIADLYGTEVD